MRVVLRERRLALGLNQDQAAELCGVQQSAYGKWERGKARPKDEHIDAVAQFLDVPRDAVVLARAAAELQSDLADRVAQLEAHSAWLEAEIRRRWEPEDPPGGPPPGT